MIAGVAGRRKLPWIRFERTPASGKQVTKSWWVFERKALAGGGLLGGIRWYGPWRGYAFFPLNGTVFEWRCLRDIATFCEAETAARRSERRRVKPVPPGANLSASEIMARSAGIERPGEK